MVCDQVHERIYRRARLQVHLSLDQRLRRVAVHVVFGAPRAGSYEFAPKPDSVGHGIAADGEKGHGCAGARAHKPVDSPLGRNSHEVDGKALFGSHTSRWKWQIVLWEEVTLFAILVDCEEDRQEQSRSILDFTVISSN